jgi:predicted CopG family antitoxin
MRVKLKRPTVTITVEEDVWAELLRLKADLRVRTYSEVIRKLIDKWKKG